MVLAGKRRSARPRSSSVLGLTDHKRQLPEGRQNERLGVFAAAQNQVANTAQKGGAYETSDGHFIAADVMMMVRPTSPPILRISEGWAKENSSNRD